MKNLKSGQRLWLALLVFVVLALAGAGVVSAQTYVKEPHGWIVAKRLTVETRADIDTLNVTNLTAPTVTMTSATTWTVASLTATTLQATNGTVTALTASGLTVNGNELITGSSTISGSQVIAGNLDVTGNIEATDHLLTQAELYLIPTDPISVTDGGVITPTSGIVELTAAPGSTVTATLATASDGQVVILANTANANIVIADAGTTYLSGNVTLAQRDTVMLVGIGVSWYQVGAESDN